MKNIICIILDSVRKDFLSIYRGKTEVPFLEKISDKGAVFENAFTVDTHTIPTHAALFTGKYPSEIGVTLEHPLLKNEIPTIIQDLKRMGYKTFAFSANALLNSSNLLKDFDYTFSPLNNIIDWGNYFRIRKYKKGVKKYFEILNYILKNLDKDVIKSFLIAYEIKKYKSSSRLILSHNELLKEIVRMKSNFGSPYFIFINLMDCHAPYSGIRNELTMSLFYFKSRWEYILNIKNFKEEEIEILQKFYTEGIRKIDNFIKEVFNIFSNDSVFIILSDHGEGFGEENIWGHEPIGLPNSIVNIPLIIYGTELKGRIKKFVSIKDVGNFILKVARNEKMTLPNNEEVYIASKLSSDIWNMLLRYFDYENIKDLAREVYGLIIRGYKGILKKYENEKEIFELRELYSQKEVENEMLKKSIKEKIHLFVKKFKKEVKLEKDEEILKRLEGLGYI